MTMVNVFDVPKDIIFDEYTEDTDNEGKVAIVRTDTDDGNVRLFAEGDGDKDWVEIELLCEKMKEDGSLYYVVIIPRKTRLIKTYDWSTAKWES